MTAPVSPRDTSRERTDLAWVRSVLAIGAVGLLLLKQVLPHVHERPGLGIAIIVLIALYALAAFWYWYDRHRRDEVSRAALAALSAATVIVGIVLLVLDIVVT
jgi:uncharacterized membrane protein YidH (DUF202 family)